MTPTTAHLSVAAALAAALDEGDHRPSDYCGELTACYGYDPDSGWWWLLSADTWSYRDGPDLHDVAEGSGLADLPAALAACAAHVAEVEASERKANEQINAALDAAEEAEARWAAFQDEQALYDSLAGRL